MTNDGPDPRRGDAVAVGARGAGGPADVPDSPPAPHHRLTFLAAHSGRTGPGYRQRPGGTPPRPAQSRLTRVPAGARAKEVPMA
jgi:hypothetical protein